MGKRVATRFDKYVFEDHEKLLLSESQKQHIQNYLAEVAEQKLAHTVDSEKLTTSLQQQAYLSGQIDALQYLLDLSIANEAAVAQEQESTGE
jgi:uncharacterized pyridoxal phosphate-containing UPF0001 family protein